MCKPDHYLGSDTDSKAVANIIDQPQTTDLPVRRVSNVLLPTVHGVFRGHVYEQLSDNIHHLALVRGDINGRQNVLVRVHSECLTGDVFRSLRCDCGAQLDLALARIVREERGVVIYLRGHEGRGIGLANKLSAYALQDQGRDTVEANIELGFPVDAREYGVAASILTDLGVRSLRLMTNNPAKLRGLRSHQLQITERVGLLTEPTEHNSHYLATKRNKLGHDIG